MGPQPWVAAAAIAALAAVVAVLALSTEVLTPSHSNFGNPWDHHKYIYLAEHGPGSLHLAPFGWRLGVPTVVSFLPVGTEVGFRLVAAASVFAAAMGIYSLSRVHGFDRLMSAGAVALYLSVPVAAQWLLYDFWLSDAAAFAIVIWVIVLVKRERLFWAAVLLVVGVLTKESVILVGTLVYSLRAVRLVDWRALAAAVAVIAPAAVTAMVLRLAIPALNTDAGYIEEIGKQIPLNRFDDLAYTLVDQFGAFGADRLSIRATFVTVPLLFILTFGVGIVVLAAVGALDAPAVALRYSPFVVVSLAQLLVARNDDRLLVLAAPALVVLGLYGVAWLADRLRIAAAWFFLPAVAVLLGNLWSGVPRQMLWGDNLVWLGGLAAVVLAGSAWRAHTPITHHDL
ncbi:MAG: hypothetical protein JJLCMIEE_01390 [Acidimicrobiales bacterium]|nr:MAG: hypothetical protein EDR02_17480 [Actinomycetota bacterium]MBV6508330.1 hypothetical protein [Acidimicrobiales bacterium]RIK07111.1 MAG: hypothetical protein DCC48_04785 [Acidobacteriota bacterium]